MLLLEGGGVSVGAMVVRRPSEMRRGGVCVDGVRLPEVGGESVGAMVG